MPNAKNTNGQLLQGKGLQIQINNKTIIEFGSRKIGSLRSTTRQLHDAVSIYMIRKSFLEFDGFNDRLKLAYSNL